MSFLTKLMMLLSARRLKPTYNVIPFLVVHDPEKEIVDRAKAFVFQMLRSMPKRESRDCIERAGPAFLTRVT